MSAVNCILIGAGGHARVLLDCLPADGSLRVVGALDAERSRWGAKFECLEILGGDDKLLGLREKGVTHFILGLGGAGNNGPRRNAFAAACAAGLQPLSIKHASAMCSARTTLGGGVQLLPLSVVNAGAELGDNVIVNSGGIVEHDCNVGAHVHIATGARLSGTVTVGSGAHLGAGCVVRQGIRIGANAVVGAGAVVINDVGDGSVVVGVPAQPIKRNTPRQ